MPLFALACVSMSACVPMCAHGFLCVCIHIHVCMCARMGLRKFVYSCVQALGFSRKHLHICKKPKGCPLRGELRHSSIVLRRAGSCKFYRIIRIAKDVYNPRSEELRRVQCGPPPLHVPFSCPALLSGAHPLTLWQLRGIACSCCCTSVALRCCLALSINSPLIYPGQAAGLLHPLCTPLPHKLD